MKNQIHKWADKFFSEYKKVFADITAKSSIAVMKQTPLPCDVKETKAEGINKIWIDMKLRAVGMNRAFIQCFPSFAILIF